MLDRGSMNRAFTLAVAVLLVGSAPAAFTAGCSSSSGAGPGGTSAPPAVYVIDSTATLFAFDGQGNALAHAAMPTPIGALNGGGMALAAGDVYVTIGQHTNRVSAYDATTLAPHSLPSGAFAGLSVPRGIAFDSNVSEFFVGNGAATVNVFDASGGAIAAAGSFPGHYGPSGVAYDADDHTIWVANYVGSAPASPPQYGVTEYTESGGSAQTFDYGSQFASPASPTEPYSIAVCPSSATGGAPLVLVGFIDDGSGQGTCSVQAYSTSGAPVGAPAQGSLTNPYSIACSTSGTVYVADRSGLYQGTIGSGGLTGLGPASGFAGLKPPIYGVLVAPGTGSGDGGAPDATTETGADAAGDAGASDATMNEGGGDGGMSDAPLQADGNGPGVPFPDDTEGGCPQPNTPGNWEFWAAVPNPYGPGFYCCGTTDWTYCPCSSPTTPCVAGVDQQTETACFDSNGEAVALYYGTAPVDASFVGGLTLPSNAFNCSAAPPGYPVPGEPSIFWQGNQDGGFVYWNSDFCADAGPTPYCTCSCDGIGYANSQGAPDPYFGPP